MPHKCFGIHPSVILYSTIDTIRTCDRRGWDYPLHLGVTEAGEGEDGRMKSAIGIGALLMDGLGDTIRVSLTEDPEFELGPCADLAAVSSLNQYWCTYLVCRPVSTGY